MVQVNPTGGTVVHQSQSGSSVAGGLAAAKDRSGVRGEPNPAAHAPTSNPICMANCQAQV